MHNLVSAPVSSSITETSSQVANKFRRCWLWRQVLVLQESFQHRNFLSFASLGGIHLGTYLVYASTQADELGFKAAYFKAISAQSATTYKKENQSQKSKLKYIFLLPTPLPSCQHLSQCASLPLLQWLNVMILAVFVGNWGSAGWDFG